MSVPFLGRLPIYRPIRIGGDTGRPIVVAEPESAAARAFRAVAEQAAAQVSIASYNRGDSADARALSVVVNHETSKCTKTHGGTL